MPFYSSTNIDHVNETLSNHSFPLYGFSTGYKLISTIQTSSLIKMNSFLSVSLAKDLRVELNETQIDRDPRKRPPFSFGSPLCCCIQCFILGSLATGIILAVALTLWLKPVSITTTSQIESSSPRTSSATTTWTSTSTITTGKVPIVHSDRFR